MLKHGLILAIALALFWMGLSGYFQPLMLTFGVISILVVLLLVARMEILDRETVPYAFALKTLSYFSWLFGQIFDANVEVVKAVLSPDMGVSPTLTRVPLDRDTDIGAVMFANSITLTPGTVSVEMEGDTVLVHALLSEMSDPEDFTDMGERAGWSVGERR